MTSLDVPIVFAKACEFFIQELTLRSWVYAVESKRKTLRRDDIANAISHEEILDFLLDVVPQEVTFSNLVKTITVLPMRKN
ncbi:hypothetical protein GIB67_001872 [Kingdonia uniflora]|uniref:Transcription factor CBF/NF-Y/archaeal histone domain-containing protein n=1 Tax=Kingdonia uniflora TaxID=39325 RepID=A0A7J7LQD1_9MAGN|nr:hypothetical protein GIB67_001872 [Kingdonia uniflora]